MKHPRKVRFVWEKSGKRCCYCKLFMVKSTASRHGWLIFTFEHMVPKSKGGTNDWSNLVACHHVCNTMRGNMDELPADFTKRCRQMVKMLKGKPGNRESFQQAKKLLVNQASSFLKIKK